MMHEPSWWTSGIPEPAWWNSDDRGPDWDPRGIWDDRFDDPRVDPDLCWHGFWLGMGCLDCAEYDAANPTSEIDITDSACE